MATHDIPAIVAAALAGETAPAAKEFTAAKRVGGTAASSLFAHPADKGTGTRVLGYDPEPGEPQDLGIEIAVADEGATIASTGPLEVGAIEAINLLPGYRAARHAEGLTIETDGGTPFDPEDVAAVLRAALMLPRCRRMLSGMDVALRRRGVRRFAATAP